MELVVMNMIKYYITLTCVFAVLSGCSTKSPNEDSPKYKTGSELTNLHGSSWNDDREKALKLCVGMTQQAVQTLLGQPYETESKTYGTQTANSWNGEMWTYRWWNRWNAKRLVIMFAKGTDSWVVNNWEWYDF